MTGEKLNYLIFEDLMGEGFETIDRRRGLDYDHLKLTMSSLAKWHAATAHLYLTVLIAISQEFMTNDQITFKLLLFFCRINIYSNGI